MTSWSASGRNAGLASDGMFVRRVSDRIGVRQARVPPEQSSQSPNNDHWGQLALALGVEGRGAGEKARQMAGLLDLVTRD